MIDGRLNNLVCELKNKGHKLNYFESAMVRPFWDRAIIEERESVYVCENCGWWFNIKITEEEEKIALDMTCAEIQIRDIISNG